MFGLWAGLAAYEDGGLVAGAVVSMSSFPSVEDGFVLVVVVAWSYHEVVLHPDQVPVPRDACFLCCLSQRREVSGAHENVDRVVLSHRGCC